MANTIRGCLLTHGVDCDVTRNYLTGDQVGLDSAQAFVEMGPDIRSPTASPSSGVGYKRLRFYQMFPRT